MDVEEKYPGYTHYAIGVRSIQAVQAEVEALGISITGGPVTFGNGHTSLFIRDPDRNVIEFTQPPRPRWKTYPLRPGPVPSSCGSASMAWLALALLVPLLLGVTNIYRNQALPREVNAVALASGT